jgi:hypothetical protein
MTIMGEKIEAEVEVKEEVEVEVEVEVEIEVEVEVEIEVEAEVEAEVETEVETERYRLYDYSLVTETTNINLEGKNAQMRKIIFTLTLDLALLGRD